MTVRIGDLAVSVGAITPGQLAEAQVLHRASGGRLGAALVALGFVSEAQITDLVARQYGLPSVNDLDSMVVSAEVLGLVPRGMLTLRASGLEKIRQGITTLDEVLRETIR